MSDWKERLLEERLDVSHRVSNLESFMQSDKIDNIDKEQKALLSVQLNAMKTYHQCLEQRIKMLEE